MKIQIKAALGLLICLVCLTVSKKSFIKGKNLKHLEKKKGKQSITMKEKQQPSSSKQETKTIEAKESLKSSLKKEPQELLTLPPKTTSNQMTNYTLHPIPYNSTFVNGSRPLPKKNTPIPDGWEDSSIVKQISTYSKKFLRDYHDPKKSRTSLLVGKNLYLEGGYTFDEQPSLLQESSAHMTGVNVVQRQYNTQEKADLWRKFLNQEFIGQYKEVQFNSQDPKSQNYNSGVEDVIKGKEVRIDLTNKMKKRVPPTDRILEKTINPIKPVIFTKDKVDDINFDTANQTDKQKIIAARKAARGEARL